MENTENLTFEQAMKRLEEIVGILESGKCSLDDSMTLFEEGAKLTSVCRGALQTAEQKIRRLQSETAAPAESASDVPPVEEP